MSDAQMIVGEQNAEWRGCEARSATPKEESERAALERRLSEYARKRAALDAAEAFDLVRAQQIKIYLTRGYATMHEYMERRLGYGPHAARERLRVARALMALPQMTMQLSRGDLHYSGVRELTRVATAETEQAWLEKAAGKTVHEIENMVAGHAPGDLPTDPTHADLKLRRVSFALPPHVYAMLRQAWVALAVERGSELSEVEMIEAMCRRVLDPGTGAEGPAHQIAYKRCRNCNEATQNGGGREFDIDAEVIEKAACDARVIGSLDTATPERATTSVTPRLREQVFARDHSRCTVPGCRSRRNLEVHHIVAQSRGGAHELSNLTLICSGHHTALHSGYLDIRGEAPYAIQFRWNYGPPVPHGTQGDAREELLRAQVDAFLDRARGVESREPWIDVPRGTLERADRTDDSSE